MTIVYLPFLPFLSESGPGSMFPRSTSVGGAGACVILIHEASRPRDGTPGPDGKTLDLECDAVAEWSSSDDCAWGGVSYFAYNEENCV